MTLFRSIAKVGKVSIGKSTSSTLRILVCFNNFFISLGQSVYWAKFISNIEYECIMSTWSTYRFSIKNMIKALFCIIYNVFVQANYAKHASHDETKSWGREVRCYSNYCSVVVFPMAYSFPYGVWLFVNKYKTGAKTAAPCTQPWNL